MKKREIVVRSDSFMVGKAKLLPTGIKWLKKLSREELIELLRIFGRMEGCLQWWVGETALKLQEDYGEPFDQEIAADLGLSWGGLRNAKSICSRIPLSSRDDNASFKHHALVAPLEPDDRDFWLKAAVENDWSVAELRRELRVWKRQKDDPPEASATVYHMDAVEYLETLLPESVDLLLTDPPYSTDIEDIESFAERWVPVALDRVKETGRAYIFTGAYPKELQAYIKVISAQDRLELGNVLVWTYRNAIGPDTANRYKLNWQACFYLFGQEAGGLNATELVEKFSVHDVAAPDGRTTGRFDPWEKPDDIAERFIRHATEEGDLVVDPFAGTGTFLAMAKRLGRIGEGSEVSEEMLRICEKKGVKVASRSEERSR